MPRRPRLAAGDLAYHVLNRRVGRLALFEKPADYAAFGGKKNGDILVFCVGYRNKTAGFILVYCWERKSRGVSQHSSALRLSAAFLFNLKFLE